VGVTADHGIVTLEGQPAGTEDIDAVAGSSGWSRASSTSSTAPADAAASTGTDCREGA
jgi:hypothetical protein